MVPTEHPTKSPSIQPTSGPTVNPTHAPTASPTDVLTKDPIQQPSDQETLGPILYPTYSMFLVKWVPIFSKQTWILAKSSHFIESPFSLEHKIFRKKWSDRQFRCFCGEFCILPVNHFNFAESPFYREKIAADFVQKFPFYRIPILSRMYCMILTREK